VHFISNTPVLSDHLSYVTIYHCSLGRSHKTALTVFIFSSSFSETHIAVAEYNFEAKVFFAL
jgi:hypothetical protein